MVVEQGGGRIDPPEADHFFDNVGVGGSWSARAGAPRAQPHASGRGVVVLDRSDIKPRYDFARMGPAAHTNASSQQPSRSQRHFRSVDQSPRSRAMIPGKNAPSRTRLPAGSRSPTAATSVAHNPAAHASWELAVGNLPMGLPMNAAVTGRNGPVLDRRGGSDCPAQAIRHGTGQHWPD